TLGLLVRKGAHIGEYAVLGALLAWALPGHSLRRATITLAIGIAYAITDEVHQLFVPGRAGQVSDVLIDTVGVVVGVAAVLFLRSRRSSPSHARHHRDRHRQRATLREKPGSSR